MNGFELFGKEHMIWLGIAAASIAAALIAGRFSQPGKDRNASPLTAGRVLGICTLLLHLFESAFRIFEGSYGPDTLPLHICAITSYLVFAHCLRPGRILGEILFCPGIAGALCALLFPDWTGYAPFSVMSFTGFLSHIAIIAYVLYAIRAGVITPSVRRCWIPVLFLAAYAAVMVPFDRYFHMNYGFLNNPSPGSVLVPLAQVFGFGTGYYVGYALLVIAGIALSYGIYYISRSTCKAPATK